MIRHAGSAADPALAPFRYRERQLNTRLHRRGERDDAQFVAEGDLVVGRAIVAGHVPDVILCDPSLVDGLVSSHGSLLDSTDIVTAEEVVRRNATGLAVALGVVGLFPKLPVAPLEEVIATKTRILVLSQVDNPTNVGAIVRSAAAFGFTGLVLDSETSDPFARRALRVAMGTTFSMRIARVDDLRDALDALHAAGHTTCSLTPAADAVNLDDFSLPGDKVALLLGSERDGLPDSVMASSNMKVRIPMHPGVDSLNVAAAAAVACYGLTRRNG
jgi:tRNA G18 (ribose-2'-O)-methylase SpoU